jgi:hypothetical protein
MRNFLIGFITVFSLINSSYGQSQSDSTETYNKVNKWAVVKLTIAYMEDLKGWSSGFEEEKINANQKQELDTYKKLNDEYAEFTNDLSLDSVAKTLSKGWGVTRAKIFQPYRSELIDSVKINHFNTVSFTPEKTQTNNSNRTEALENINREYDKLMSEKSVILSKVKGKKVSRQNVNDIVTPNKKEIDWGQMILYALLFFSLILNVLFLRRLRTLLKVKPQNTLVASNSKRKRNSNGWNDIKMEGQMNTINEQINKIEELNKENKRLSKIISNNNIEVKGTYQPTGDRIIETKVNIQPTEDEKSVPVTLKVSEIKNKLIYFSSPFEERRFAVEEASEMLNSNSLYVVRVDHNTNKGEISLISKADLTRALNSPDSFLETVCDYENAYSLKAKGIIVVEDGKAVLEGEDWVVKSKIKIKFI